jgi:hypothetical protein
MATTRTVPISAAISAALNDDATLPSYTIGEFCIAEKISPPTYYKLRHLGLGPREMHIGAAVRISHDARLDWQRARENPQGAELEAVRSAAEGRRQRSHAAIKRALASPRHISKRRRQPRQRVAV